MLRAIKGRSLLIPALVLLVCFFLLPSLDVFHASFFDPDFTARHYERMASVPVYLRVFLNTFQVSLVVALLAGIVGYPIAYFINSHPRHIQVRLVLLIFVPLWMSILIRSYSWMILLGRDGVINSLLMDFAVIESPLRLLYTSGAVYVAMLQILLPVQIVACYSAMTEINMDLMRAARICGARPSQALRRVFIPLSMDGTVTGMTIVFMLSMGFFITPALIGGRQDLMLGNLIMQQVEQLNWGFGSAIAVFLLMTTLVCVVFLRLIGRIVTRLMV